MSPSIHRVVIADIDWNDLPFLDQQFQCDAVRQVDRYRMQTLELA
jgi:hypothetical protein